MSKAIHPRFTASVEARLLALFFLLACLPLPARAAERMNVAQLMKATAELHGLPDQEAAQRLAVFELTERLTRTRFKQLSSTLPGDKSRQALLALADASAFLDLPAADLIDDPPPDPATQGRIISSAADFVVATVSRMPDFFASRTTTRFQDSKIAPSLYGGSIVSIGSFALKDRTTDTVTFRNGREVTEASAGKRHENSISVSSGLANWGIFGPLLGVVMADLLKGKVGWGHWEQGSQGKLAVFRYAVARDRSNYTVRYCCFRSEEGDMREFMAIPAYHGEIAIDPASGAVFRLVLKTNLQPANESGPSLPIDRLDVLVEYGPVDIGGKTCICPVESATISRAEALVFHGYTFYADKNGRPDETANRKKHVEAVSLPKVTAINDVVFEDYHQFRGEVRIVPTDDAAPELNPPPASPPKAPTPHSLP
jgi:hypothetical protein